MLTIEERGRLRQTCKAFREVRVQEDYFDAPYVMLLRRNGIQLITKDGEYVIQCIDSLLGDTSFGSVRCMLDQFARIIKDINKVRITKNSVISVECIVYTLNRAAPALYDVTITLDERTGTYGGYNKNTSTFTVDLDTYRITEVGNIKTISFPTRIPESERNDFYNRFFDYIKYPKLILSPSDN